MNKSVTDRVKEYYGTALSGSEDLKTDACCTVDSVPDYIKPILAKIHPEVSSKYYGCGLVAPEQLAGLDILDLGSGSGQDCYLLSALVGEQGSVLGVDMTEEQLTVANRHVDYHRQQFGFGQANVKFVKGYLEQLGKLGLPDNGFDVIVSNCVINLCQDKQAVLSEAYRVLKPGGELYFSDVYTDRRVPQSLVSDPVLYGECLSGALYLHDFMQLARAVGFADPRLVSDRPLSIDNPEVQQKVGDIGFFSAVYRLFKLDSLEAEQEDFGQKVKYRGTVTHHRELVELDKFNRFPMDEWRAVSGNTFNMLRHSRFAEHFEFSGDFSNHTGVFQIGENLFPFDREEKADAGCCA